MQFLQDLVDLLKPFLDATEFLSGLKYATLSFVYPTMYLLMNTFSIGNKYDNELLELIRRSVQDTSGNFFKPYFFY